MRLITFAYQGEAQCFLSSLKHKVIEYCSIDYYENEDTIVLITGEGVQLASEKVSILLAHFSGQIKEIYNFGIAGALTKTINKDEIIQIRTSYRAQQEKMIFKSFTNSECNGAIDCVTADERVLTDDVAAYHSNFAQIVDRELWGISSAASHYGLNVNSYKLISDHAGNETSCFDIKNQAFEYSEMLFNFYSGLNISESVQSVKTTELLPSEFHCSISQERKLNNLLDTLKLKKNTSNEEILNATLVKEIIEKEKNRKKRTILLLEQLELELNPFQAELEKKISKIVKPFSDIQARLKFTKHYENNHFELSMKIEHELHLNKLKDAIESFNYEEINCLLNGDSE
jgi:nucleoside phosphorylase